MLTTIIYTTVIVISTTCGSLKLSISAIVISLFTCTVKHLCTTTVVVWQTPEANHICDAVSVTWHFYMACLYWQLYTNDDVYLHCLILFILILMDKTSHVSFLSKT
ncbi:hypothetical protein VPH35_111578 [Triticum aestivum]